MEVASSVEHRRPYRESAAQRLAREFTEFTIAFTRTGLLALLIAPVVLFAFLTADLPIRVFDVLFDDPAMKPSQWLSVGGGVIATLCPGILFVARRFGGDEASTALTAGWGVAAVLTFAGLSYLAPYVTVADMPKVRFVVGFVSSALIGQYAAVAFYDIVRGGGAWWRPPFLSALVGLITQTLIYFPAVYAGVAAHWPVWLAFNLILAVGLAAAFLPIYWTLQGLFRPRGGFGA